MDGTLASRHERLKPQASSALAAGDILLLDAHVAAERIEELLSIYSTVHLPLADGVASLASFSQDLGMIKAIVTAQSPLIGQTVHQAQMRSDVGITVIGLRRGQKSITEEMLNEVLRAGDTLLITGWGDGLQRVNQQHTGLVLINTPREMTDILPAASKAPQALALIFSVTALLGMFISITATAILMAPEAMSIAAALDVSPLPLALMVCVAASTAFMTPVSSPGNTLVVGPGKYILADFIRVGVPLSILVFLISVILIPILLPF